MKLTSRVLARLERDFGPSKRDRAVYVIESVDVGDDETDGSERMQAAMLMLAQGNLDRLLEAAALAETDWRDLLMSADLGHEDWRRRVDAYLLPPAAPHHGPDPQRQLGASWETLLDRQIREAAEAGSFANLPHQGKPLPIEENPYAAEWGLAFHVLRNAGFAPPWIEADKEVRALVARRDGILARAASGPAPTESARRRDRSALERLVAEINASIARVNAEAPSPRQHRRALVLADELDRYHAACRR